jgi:hypothetical protein
VIVSISQPAYLPWMGYFHRIAVSDLHVSLDDVDIGHRSFANRNRVLTANGPTWLTVPLRTKGPQSTLINEVAIATDTKWRRKHWRTIEQSYAGAPYFDQHSDFWEGIFAREWELLEDLTRETTAYQLEALGIDTPIVRSSEMGVAGTKSDLILNLCSEVDADVYLSGPLGRDYLDEEKFHERGIRIEYHDYAHPIYSQAADEFVSHLAAIDALFNCGPRTREVLMCGNQTKAELSAA